MELYDLRVSVESIEVDRIGRSRVDASELT
jgi:hypothetical protein